MRHSKLLSGLDLRSMSILFSFLLLIVSNQLRAQTKYYKYIELTAYVYLGGQIEMDPLLKPRKKNYPDSLEMVIYKEVNTVIAFRNTAIDVINNLSKINWQLVSSVGASKNSDSIPSGPFIVYYFRKEYEK